VEAIENSPALSFQTRAISLASAVPNSSTAIISLWRHFPTPIAKEFEIPKPKMTKSLVGGQASSSSRRIIDALLALDCGSTAKLFGPCANSSPPSRRSPLPFFHKPYCDGCRYTPVHWRWRCADVEIGSVHEVALEHWRISVRPSKTRSAHARRAWR